MIENNMSMNINDNIMEDLSELDEVELEEGTHLDYQVWLLGHGEYDDCTDFEYFIDNFDTLTEAEKCAAFFEENNLNVIKNKDPEFFIPADTYSVDVVIEVQLIDDESGDELECLDSYTFCNKKIK